MQRRDDPDALRFMAATIAAGMVQIHGLSDPEIADKSISLAQWIDQKVEQLCAQPAPSLQPAAPPADPSPNQQTAAAGIAPTPPLAANAAADPD